MTDAPKRAAIVGGGIAGLTTAYHLAAASDWEPVVFEASATPGGRIRSEMVEGYCLDAGPHTILQRNRATAELIDDLGLRPSVVEPSDGANTRYVVRDGDLVPVPMSVSDFLTTDLVSTRAKLRLLAEPLVPARRAEFDESLANFVRRRLGPEILEYAVDPMVGGVFAGRPRLLSARHAFEDLWALEHDSGSLTAGLLRRAIAKLGSTDDEPERTLLSFEGGAASLVDALVETLGDSVRCDREVTSAERGDGEGWRLEFAGGEDAGAGPFEMLVWTAPAYELAEFALRDGRGGADLSQFADVYYPPVAVVATGFDRNRVAHPLDGFGCLVPETEPYRILGSLFMSSLFPDRAPPGSVLLSTFVGGSRAPEMAERPPDELETVVLEDLGELLGLHHSPEMAHVTEWERAIPQYEVGYGRILDRLDELESRFDGLRFTGSFRDGIAVPDLIEAARETARTIDATL